VKCEPSGCQPLQTSEFHVFSTLEGTPGDGYIGGSLGCCSDFYVVNVPPATNKTGNFCGVQSPLRPPTSPPAPAKAGSAIAVKFELVLQGTPCSGTDFITDAIAVISAEHCATGTGPGTGKDCLGDQHMNTNPTGSANDLPLFRYDFTNNIYLYNLQTKLPDGTPWPTGIYSVVITANDFKPQLVFIQLN
jgi:hypothetical protein